MIRFALFAAATAVLAALSFAAPAQAAPDRAEVSAQSRQYSVRQRPRIRVQPRYYPRSNYITLYPLPNDMISFPGPNMARQCVSRLVPEYRPSGTVIVPRMWCRWVPR